MHQVISVTDILLAILANLDAHPSSLAAFARTCTSLHEPAIGVLWSRLYNLVPLIKLFPDDAWEMKLKEEEDARYQWRSPMPVVNLTRAPVAPHDWLAFDKYACLVRHLGSDMPVHQEFDNRFAHEHLYYAREHISLTTWQMLAVCRRTSLVPWLQSVVWPLTPCHNDIGTILYLQLLVCPQLRRVTVNPDFPLHDEESVRCNLPPLESILGALHTTCPNLEAITMLSFSGPLPSAPIRLSVSSRLSSHLIAFRHLKSIQCRGVKFSVRDVLRFSAIPVLESLSIDMFDDDNAPIATENTYHTSTPWIFASLTRMSIRLYSLQCYMKLAVASPSFPQVEELELSADALTQSSIPQLAPVFANIASLFPPDTLTKITIRDYSSYAHLTISQNVAITPQILRHLFIFRNLRQLRIAAWSWRTEYGDNLLVDMAAAWPNLRHLDLNTSVEASGWEKSRFLVTLRGMLTLAWRCRELNYLGVLFHADPSSFPDHEELLEQDLRVVDGSPVLASLRRLNVSWSTITNPEQVAAIVSKFFLPSMTVDSACGRWSNGDFESDTGTESSDNEAWGSVAGLLPVLCGVREEERKRARRLVASGRFSAI